MNDKRLPTITEMSGIDPDFTGGQSTEEYMADMRGDSAPELRDRIAALVAERDAARAWAAAWRVSAHYWKAQQKFTGYAWAWTDGKIGGDEYFERTDKVRDWMYANVPAFVLERIDKRLSDNLSRAADARRADEAMERR